MGRRITIKTLAEQSGVTHGTVSRALNFDPRVRPATAERIRALAVELGYTPSRLGRALRTSRTLVLGFVVADVSHPYFSGLLRGVHDAILPAGYSLLVAETGADPGREALITAALAAQHVDGLLICLPDLPEPFLQLLDDQPFPIVVVNNHHGVDYPASVSNNDRYGARAAVEHLLALGHRRIGYLSEATGGGTNAVRLSSYRETLLAAGLEPRREDLVESPQPGLSAGAEAVRAWLRGGAAAGGERATALFCYNDVLALAAMRACRDAGLRIPDDLSIVGFDDIDMAAYCDPPLTTFAQPRHDLGVRAGELLLRLIEGEPPPPEPLMLCGELVVRGSSARLREPGAIDLKRAGLPSKRCS